MSQPAAPADGEAIPSGADLARWIGETIELAAIDPEVDGGEALAAADDLAAALRSAGPAERRRALAELWHPVGLAATLSRTPITERAGVADDIIAAAGDNRAYLHELCVAALAQAMAAAQVPADALAPDGAASLLTTAYNTSGGGAGYAAALVAAAGTGKPPAVLDRLLAALARQPVPAELSRIAATLHSTAFARFGGPVALALVRGHVMLRVIAVALEDRPELSAVAALLRTACAAPGTPPREAIDEAMEQIVAAGQGAEAIAADREDPDDPATQRGAVLLDELSLTAAFAEPSPPDPLGTLPVVRLTWLGQEILAARQKRSVDYDWESVAWLRESDPAGFAALLIDERCEVLDLVTPPAA